MDMQKVRAFLLIEQHKSFSAAAAALSYTPSALSHMADALEAELGVRLFNRYRRGVELTEAGRALLPRFQAILEDERALFEAATVYSDLQNAELRIGAYSSIALYLLPELLQRFKPLHPEARISILVADSFRPGEGEEQPDVIFAERRPSGMSHWFPMVEDEFVAVIPSGMFPGRRTVTREALYDCTYIRTEVRSLDEYFDRARFREVIDHHSVEYESVLSMVKEGMGVAVLPRLALRRLPAGVRTLRLEPRTGRTLGVGFRDDARVTGAARAFVQFLQDAGHVELGGI